MLPDSSLRIVPKHGPATALPNVAELHVRECSSVGRVIRDIVSYYVVGFDTISVTLPEGRCVGFLTQIKEFVDKRMIGVEVVEESANSLTLQCLTKYTALPVFTAFKRMVRAADYMLQDVIGSLRSFREDVLKQVVEMDDIVDRFYLFVLRQLNAVILGIMSPADLELRSYFEVASLRMAAKFVERIGDHAQAIASEMLRVGATVPPDALPVIEDFMRRARDCFLRAARTIVKYDVDEAHAVIEEALKARDLEDRLVREALRVSTEASSAILIKRLAESARRVMEYSADIAEVTINTATAHRKILASGGF